MSPLPLSLPLPLPGTARGAAFGQIVRNEIRLAWRRPIGLIGSLGVPVLLTVLFGELPSFHQIIPKLGGLTLYDTYVPIIMTLGLAMLTLWGLPSPLVSYRELGILLANSGLYDQALLHLEKARPLDDPTVEQYLDLARRGLQPVAPVVRKTQTRR